MKVQRGSKENSTHSETPHYAELSGQFHVPAALSSAKETFVNNRIRGWSIWRKEKSFTPTMQRNPNYPARNLVTLPTTDNSRTRLKRHRFLRHLVYSVRCCGISYFLTV